MSSWHISLLRRELRPILSHEEKIRGVVQQLLILFVLSLLGWSFWLRFDDRLLLSLCLDDWFNGLLLLHWLGDLFLCRLLLVVLLLNLLFLHAVESLLNHALLFFPLCFLKHFVLFLTLKFGAHLGAKTSGRAQGPLHGQLTMLGGDNMQAAKDSTDVF